MSKRVRQCEDREDREIGGEAAHLGFAVALVVFALDQLSKWIVTGPLGVNQIGAQHYLLPIFHFTYTENNGISLGLLNATNPSRALDAGRADRGDRHRRRRAGSGARRTRVDQVALGMVLGGALGNILDRVRFMAMSSTSLDLHFGEFRPFLIFNVGDAAISIAVVILLLRAFLSS